MSDALSGVSVLVAGAGLAGLCAAHDLAARGAEVRVVDPRDRVGGRVTTARDGFTEGQHGEAGADMIDEGHTELRQLAESFGLPLVRILKDGFGGVRTAPTGKIKLVRQTSRDGWAGLAAALEPLAHDYRLGERRWDTPIAAAIARRSVARWLDDVHASEELRQTATSLRGFFLADPEELSLLALVDQLAAEDSPGRDKMYRIQGGNDRLPAAIAAALGERIHLGTELVAVSQRGKQVRVALKRGRQPAQLTVDYVVLAMPATLVRRVPITPALPAHQHEAITRLRYGRGTKTLIQFAERFWKQPLRPRAFGSPLSCGAIWDGNEEQRGRPGILTFLAGGSASDQTHDIVTREGIPGLAQTVSWLGYRDQPILGSAHLRWDADPWARGGYAVFDPDFDPALRGWLARPFGRLFFAGEHTSLRWQGYMNGAVESGRRAAAEIVATHGLGGGPKNGVNVS